MKVKINMITLTIAAWLFVAIVITLAFAGFVQAAQPEMKYSNIETPAATAAQWSCYLLRKQL